MIIDSYTGSPGSPGATGATGPAGTPGGPGMPGKWPFLAWVNHLIVLHLSSIDIVRKLCAALSLSDPHHVTLIFVKCYKGVDQHKR